jgi:hypothetical protein
MPLIKAKSKSKKAIQKAISQNIREFHTGKTYARTKKKYGSKRANKQAIAAAIRAAKGY